MNAKKKLPTSAEVERRLRIASELRNLCLSLGRARKLARPPGTGSEERKAAVRDAQSPD